MLVLSRKQDESIVIHDDIQVTVLEVKGNRVRLGITAPDHVSIMREEISNGPVTPPLEQAHSRKMIRGGSQRVARHPDAQRQRLGRAPTLELVLH